MPDDEEVSMPPDGQVISFMLFHERGLMISSHYFFRGLLHHYDIELQHLNPKGVQHIATFVTLCEGYLGVEPHFKLWKYFFIVSLQKKREKKGEDLPVLIGCARIHLQGHRAYKYVTTACQSPIKGGTDNGST
jgi:hypothetical protein